MAVLFALGVVLTAGQIFFFGSSKVRPLFGMSAEALAGDRDAGPDPSEPKPLDLDAIARQPDAGRIRVR
jgi:hypothetical protein